MRRSISSRSLLNIVSWSVFALLLTTYWLTTSTTVSYWDCPEYVTAAALLEIGHPPGNPVWMLVERIVTMLAPSPEWCAYAVNLSSGIFTAFAGFFLARVIFASVYWLSVTLPHRKRFPAKWGAAGSAAIGALAFGWCDSAWYSAVEAEVYAMSIFLTALCVWLMVKWAFAKNPHISVKLLILLAYILGLSIGVHQLNLLCIPALALMWGLRRGIRSPLKLLVVIMLGMLVVGCVLIGMMPSAISIAANLEIWCVNTLGLPKLSGVVLYLGLTGGALLLVLVVTARSHNRGVVAASAFPAIFLSGIFNIGGNAVVGAAVSALMTLLLVRPNHFDVRRLNLAFWMLAMLLTGYGAYALIPVRGGIPFPANPTMPGEPFAFAAYQAREQYGATPLLYGPTPYSAPMFQEEWTGNGKIPRYFRYALLKGNPQIVPFEQGARFSDTPDILTHDDSLINARGANPDKPGYVVKGHRLQNIFTPELNCWFPRITSRDPIDIRAYGDWVGMDTSTMARVAITEAFDTLGNPVAKMGNDGTRSHPVGYKPTIWQNLSFLGSYQISYMYLRYLMWNFCGRQNDIPSQGEVEHGNFITGIRCLDNAMLGAEEMLPGEAGEENRGRNKYYMLPLILGLTGLIWLSWKGRRRQAVAAITLLLFFMTGIAIVIYLNQTPGEPRERDYSFLGSFWTFGIWIGYGALAVARLCRTYRVLLPLLAIPGLMCAQNFDDHDRRGRNAASTIARATLESLEPNAIIFVDGDNLTFPLWYAQEVEGVRRDVRIVNVSYLSIPSYAANLMRRWRESEPVASMLKREDIIYDALAYVRVPASGDTLPAVELLQRLKENPKAEFAAAYALIPGLPDSISCLDLRKLSVSGKERKVPLRGLLTLDIIATNTALTEPRPLYWSNAMNESTMMRLDSAAFTEMLWTRRLGNISDSARIELISRGIEGIGFPNTPDREVYMDPAPARMVGIARKSLVLAARGMIDDGKINDAVTALNKADIVLGNNPASYPFIKKGKDLVNIRTLLGELQKEAADSLLSQEGSNGCDSLHLRAKAMELKARGDYNIRQHSKRMDDWMKYRRALPARLRHLTVPLS